MQANRAVTWKQSLSIGMLVSSMLFIFTISSASALSLFGAKKEPLPNTATYEVYFSPSNETEDSIVRFINEARKSVHVAAYSFTAKEVAMALLNAHQKGIDVRVVVDKGEASKKYSAATFLANQGVPVRVDARYSIQHSKYVISEQGVETGSYNYSSAARKSNSENVLIIRGVPSLTEKYEQNWRRLWDESAPLERRY